MRIQFQKTSFEYEAGRRILNDVSFATETGECLLIVGQNGVGKSTLLKLLNGILKPTAGRVLVGDLDTAEQPTSRLAREVCVTFQNPADQIFAPSVRREVEFAPSNLKRKNTEELVNQALTLCRLDSLSLHHPYDLPPAQRKLLTIASAMASGSPFLAFDEPSSGLSQIERSILEDLVSSIKRDSRGLIVVSHDLGLFLRYASRVMILGQGQLIYEGKPEEIMENEGFLRRAGLRLPLPMRLERILK